PKAAPARLRIAPRSPFNLVPKQTPASTSRPAGAKAGTSLAGEKLAVGTNFTGATLPESGFVPPDSMGAAGPTQFLLAVNGRIRVFSKTDVVGSLNTSLDAFFAPVLPGGAGPVDPEVRYDTLSGRWFVLAIDDETVNNRVLLAVSDTATITNATVWSFFFFQQNLVSPAGDTTYFADFPSLAIDANALYVGVNVFDAGGTLVSTSAFVIRKSSVTGGGPIVVTAFRDLINAVTLVGPESPQGVDNADPAATSGYFVGADFAA